MTHAQILDTMATKAFPFEHLTADEQAALKAGAEALRAHRWHPIETAPRDHESTIVVRDTHACAFMWWSEDKQSWENDEGSSRQPQPTHWAPIPSW